MVLVDEYPALAAVGRTIDAFRIRICRLAVHIQGVGIAVLCCCTIAHGLAVADAVHLGNGLAVVGYQICAVVAGCNGECALVQISNAVCSVALVVLANGLVVLKGLAVVIADHQDVAGIGDISLRLAVEIVLVVVVAICIDILRIFFIHAHPDGAGQAVAGGSGVPGLAEVIGISDLTAAADQNAVGAVLQLVDGCLRTGARNVRQLLPCGAVCGVVAQCAALRQTYHHVRICRAVCNTGSRSSGAGQLVHAGSQLGCSAVCIVIEAVIVTDDRNRILARTADEVQRYHFFNAVCGKANGGAFCPGILTGENAVTGNHPELVAVSRIQCDAAGPVDRLVPNPAVTAVLQIVCNQRPIPVCSVAGSHFCPGFAAVFRLEETVAPCNGISVPGISSPRLGVPLCASGCHQLVGILRVTCYCAITDIQLCGSTVGSRSRCNVFQFIGLGVILISITSAAVEHQTVDVGDQQVAVRIQIDSGGHLLGGQIFAQGLEIVAADFCHVEVCLALDGSADVDLAVCNFNRSNTIDVQVFVICDRSYHMLCPGRPFDAVFEQPQLIIAHDRTPGVAAVLTHNEGRIAGSGIAAAVDDIRVVRIHGDCLTGLSAVAVAVYLNQIGNVDLFKGFAGIAGTENDGSCIAEICTAAQQIQGVVIVGVNAHGINAQEAAVSFVQEVQQLNPFFLFIVIAVCTAYVGTGIHLIVTGDDTGNTAAGNVQCIPIHRGFDRVRSRCRQRLADAGSADSRAQQCGCGEHGNDFFLFGHGVSPFKNSRTVRAVRLARFLCCRQSGTPSVHVPIYYSMLCAGFQE